MQSQVSATSVHTNVGAAIQQGQSFIQFNNQDNEVRLAQVQANLAAAQVQATSLSRISPLADLNSRQIRIVIDLYQ